MSRRSTKARRAALWRREWCARYREWAPRFGDAAADMAAYSEALLRGPDRWRGGLIRPDRRHLIPDANRGGGVLNPSNPE